MIDIMQIGLIDDPRSAEEKAKDFTHRELYGVANIEWKEIPESEYPKYSLKNQDGSFSCGGEAGSKAMETLFNEVLSSAPLYRGRPNYPQTGMWAQGLGFAAKNIGTVAESLMPSQLLNEEQMNNIGDVSGFPTSDIRKIGNYISLDSADTEGIAHALDMGYPVIYTFKSTYEEWNQNVPQILLNQDLNGPRGIAHFNCIPPGGRTLYQGKTKAFISEESWGHITTIGGGGQRIVTADFLAKRGTGAMYFIPKQEITIPKPKHLFTKNLTFGMYNDEVALLQDCLKYEGCMVVPTGADGEILPSTKYFGSITKAAVIKFQEKYRNDILVPLKLNSGTGNFLEKTRAKMNQIYG